MAIALTRRMLVTEHPMTAHGMESAFIPSRGSSADAREGVAAFLEKRVPAFPDHVSAGLPEV